MAATASPLPSAATPDSHEGDFQTCLVWSTRPGRELPVLMIVTNNRWGISTPENSLHAEKHISDRGRPYGIPGVRRGRQRSPGQLVRHPQEAWNIAAASGGPT